MIDDTCKIDKILPLIFRLDKDTIYDVKINKHREKRSLNANAYLWKLVTEIGNVLNKSKEEVYLQMLIDYGQSEMVSILSEIDVKGYFKYYKLAGTSILNGKEFNHYKIYSTKNFHKAILLKNINGRIINGYIIKQSLNSVVFSKFAKQF